MRRTLGLALAILLSVAASPAIAQDGSGATAEVFPRFRLGGSAGLGYGTKGMAGAASARAGVQIKSSWAVSYQFSAVVTEEELFGNNSDTWQSHTLLAEFTIPNTLITLGGGPSIVSGHLVQPCGAFCTAPSVYYTEVGFDLRAGMNRGANRPNVRGGFTLELAVHSSMHDALAVLGIGADLF